MPSIRLDKVHFSSLHESFRNRQILNAAIVVSGTIPAATHQQFYADLPLTRDGAVFETYSKVDSNPRRRVDSNPQLIDLVWASNSYVFLTQPLPNTLRITIDIDNPGLATSIATQTVNFIVYVFDTPFA